MTPNHASPKPPARRRRSTNSWRPFAVVFGIALTALVMTIIFVACGGDTNPNTPTPAPGTPGATSTPGTPGTSGTPGDTSSPEPTTPVSTDGTIAPDVTVNGVGLGSMTQDDARIALANGLPDVSTGKLTINIGELTQDVTYASVGRAYDIDAIIIAAFASGGGAVTPTVTYNADALAQQVNAFVATAQAQPVNATISYVNGQYVMAAASSGSSVDGAAVLSNAGGLIANGNPADQTLDVQVTTVPVDITSAAAQAAIARAQAVTAQPLTLTAAGHSFVVDAITFRTWVQLQQTSADAPWNLTVDETALTAYLNTVKTQVDQPAVDAQWHFGDSAQPIVTPSQTGYEVDAVAGTQLIETTLAAAQGPVGPIALPVVTTEPNFTTAEAQAQAGNVQLLGEWTTHYIPNSFNNNGINIRRPASLIDGTVIQPGDVFDFYKLTQPYTIANGYGPGAALIHGHIKADGVLGGGLCSASTTMFNAGLRAGFQMGARYNHAYYISRYPIGLDATIWVSGSSVKNMTFTNDSKYPIVVRAINAKRAVTFQVWGVSDGRTVNLADPVVTNPVTAAAFYEFTNDLAPRVTAATDDYLVDGFDAVVVRTVRNANGDIIHQDTFKSHYTKVDVVVLLGRCNNDPPATTRIPYTDVPPPCNGATPTPSHTPNPSSGPTPTPGPTASPTAPHAGFNYSINGSSVTFTNTSSGATSYSWDFGDSSALKHGTNPTHNYTATGDYTVTLSATNSVGSDTHSETFHVDVPTPTDSPTPSDTPAPSPS